VEVRVLGPIEVVGDNGPIPLGAPMHRRLLAALTSRLGETCSSDALVEALWSGAPPRSASKLLQVYTSQLRKVLPAGARIDTRGGGYALELERDSVDAVRFESLLARGHDALQDGHAALADSVLQRALALWRGVAFGEFAYEEFARFEAERLEELRLVCVEDRVEAELRLGRHDELLPELLGLARAHPLRDRLQGQAMLALFRSGRQTEALECYAAMRGRLRDELGLEPSSELRELQRRILQQDPKLAPRAERRAEGSLPLPTNALVGRERELRELHALLVRADLRLLVLTGAGGSGKTRLAIEAAREAAPFFADGCRFVPLAPVRDPALVLQTISRALGVTPVAGEEPLDTLGKALRRRELLLVLDNAEHLRAAAAVYVELLDRAPRLTLLVTSRAVLHLTGERAYPVHPLHVDAAAALFLQRAREGDPDFDPAPAEEDVIGRICTRLDGLPLAIELVASRIRTLRPAELLRWLEPRLPLLAGGPRDLPARQQTLRATLAWSIELLGESEQRDVAHLSVFAGGWTVDAAKAISRTNNNDLLALVEHNLVEHASTAHGTRHSMLETIREFAHELLEDSGEADETRRRHAEFFLALAESANLCVEALGRGPQRHDLVLPEQANLRVALDWALEADAELGLRLAVALENYWATNAPLEGERRIEDLLARRPDAPVKLRARARRVLGGMAEITDDFGRAQTMYQHSLELFKELSDEAGEAMIVFRLGSIAEKLGEHERGRKLTEQALEKFELIGHKPGQCVALGSLGLIEVGEEHGPRARELFERSAALAHEIGFRWWEAVMLGKLGELLVSCGDLQLGETRSLEALSLFHRIGARANSVLRIAVIAWAAAELGDFARAGKLWGAIEAEEARDPIPGWEGKRDTYEQRVVNGPNAVFARARQDGQTLSLDEAVEEALTGR
jgi:predicted ATPase/DNA-binding SARP family transcriptional activator